VRYFTLKSVNYFTCTKNFYFVFYVVRLFKEFCVLVFHFEIVHPWSICASSGVETNPLWPNKSPPPLVFLTTGKFKYSVHAVCSAYGVLSRRTWRAPVFGNPLEYSCCVAYIVCVVEFRSLEVQSLWKIKPDVAWSICFRNHNRVVACLLLCPCPCPFSATFTAYWWTGLF
jgi:hypothetical protein